jgi:hypothetical protein
VDHVQAFRKHADECRQMASSTNDPESRATWNSLTERWLHCAEVAEHAMAEAMAAAGGYNRTRRLRQWSGPDVR